MQGWLNTVQFSISSEEYFLSKKHSYFGQYWFQIDCFLYVSSNSDTEGILSSRTDAIISQNQTSSRKLQQFLLFWSLCLTSCTPDGPDSFGSVFSANQRITTCSQYYFCLQEDPHHTLHILFTTLVKSY